MKDKNFKVVEYKLIYSRKSTIECDYDENGNLVVTEKIFDALEKFYYANNSLQSYFLPTKIGSFKALQAQNYIGVIQLKDGTTIEILPKIADLNDDKKIRNVVVKMLCTLKNSPFEYFDYANLKLEKMPLLEIFISMFLDEVARLVQKGLKNDYVGKEENLPFLRGKLKFSEHLRQNLVHKERFFVAYEEYISDRVENRLIKTTLEYLYKRSKNSSNQQRIRKFLFVFDEIGVSLNPKSDFSKVRLNRQMKDYEQVLLWCKLFLMGNSFSPFGGDDVAFALLYDMNLLFESYVASWLKKRFVNIQIEAQDKKHHLIEKHTEKHSDGKRFLGKKFLLKPDIVGRKGGNVAFIADTKWKIIDSSLPNKNYQISQDDMYQMFAYGKKYGAKRLYLIYPKNENFKRMSDIASFVYEDGMRLRAIPFDLQKSLV